MFAFHAPYRCFLCACGRCCVPVEEAFIFTSMKHGSVQCPVKYWQGCYFSGACSFLLMQSGVDLSNVCVAFCFRLLWESAT